MRRKPTHVLVPWDRWKKNLARRIAKKRRQAGYSQEFLAAAMCEPGVMRTNQTTMSDWERGDQLPALESLFWIAQALELDLKSLLPVTRRRTAPKRRRRRVPHSDQGSAPVRAEGPVSHEDDAPVASAVLDPDGRRE